MNNFTIIFILLSFFISEISSQGPKKPKSKNKPINKIDDNSIRQDPENINILSIAYELTYLSNSVLKVVLKSIDDLEHDFKFDALLKSEIGKKDYKLRCQNVSITDIECYSERNIRFDLQDKYYFHYTGNEKLTLDEKMVMEDWKKVTLIFKPEMYEDQIMWKDHRKILGLNNRKIVGGGFLYLVPKSKKLLHRTRDGFNKYIELNNFISHAGLYGQRPENSLSGYMEAIRRGFHIVDAELRFTKDKVPVIIHERDLEKVSDGNGPVSRRSMEDLEKLDFGSKFNEKYKGEKILTFKNLLKLCHENNVIIDLDLSNLNYHKYFEKTDEYIQIIFDMIKHYNMFDSIYFSEGQEPLILSALKKLKNDISISVNIDKKEKVKLAMEKYKGSKRIIFDFSELVKKGSIDDQTIQYIKDTGNLIKASQIDDLELAQKLQSKGINLITTNQLQPFFAQNEYEPPILLKCTQFDILADCRLGPEVKLIDNEVYNIYYSENIYYLYENIIDEPIGEFKYLDTNQLDDKYYTVRIFDFENSYLKLNSSVKVDKGEIIKGKVGPCYEHVADAFLYDFYCVGNNKYDVHCKILKNDTNIVEFDGNYTIHVVENYSLYVAPNTTKENTFLGINFKNNRSIIYFPSVIFMVIATFIIIYSFKGKNNNKLKQIEIIDSYNNETNRLN